MIFCWDQRQMVKEGTNMDRKMQSRGGIFISFLTTVLSRELNHFQKKDMARCWKFITDIDMLQMSTTKTLLSLDFQCGALIVIKMQPPRPELTILIFYVQILFIHA